ncbi:MAG TPA: hypothetical protein VI819_02030 [Patescibacteria group bacterium]|nr:hypothetical protein [Patescibacteria group bacterium]
MTDEMLDINTHSPSQILAFIGVKTAGGSDEEAKLASNLVEKNEDGLGFEVQLSERPNEDGKVITRVRMFTRK